MKLPNDRFGKFPKERSFPLSAQQRTLLHPLERVNLTHHKMTYGQVGITAETVPWYLSRVHQLDHNLDGRIDLAFWNQDHFDVYHQGENGQFGPVAETFETDVLFDFDAPYSLLFGHGDKSTFSLLVGLGEKVKRTVLHSLRDLNGDGIEDMIVQTIEGRSIIRQKSTFNVHFGQATSEGLAFASEASSTIHPGGKAGAISASGYSTQSFLDATGDGHIDIAFVDVDVGLGGMFRGLVGNSAPIDLEFYKGENGLYPETPTLTRKIRRFAPFDGLGNVFFPAIMSGDINGDGRTDLVVGQSPKELHVFFGVSGPNMLAEEPERFAVELPSDERNIRLFDLNGDGKQDVLIHNPSKVEPHRLITLIAR